MNSQPKKLRKIRILYADDRSENVRSLLEGVRAAGLLPRHLAEGIILYQLDLEENIKHNHVILRHAEALVELDYATLMHEAIDKVRDSKEPYDLIVSDWYFGEYDPKFKDSQIGGIWIMLWGQHRHKKYKPICKLYTAQHSDKQKGIDFIWAQDYIKSAFDIKIAEVRKSETADSWQQHLEEYLLEVAQSIFPRINKNDLVEVINYISDSLAFNRFNNSVEDNAFESFRKDLLKLNDFDLCLADGKAIKLAHLFPLLLGRYLYEQGESVFATMPHEEIAALLYARRLKFYERDARNEKIEHLQQAGVECEEFKGHDGSGNPIYGIQVKSGDYYEGPLATITNLFIQSLDYTFKVQTFYLNERGFNKWLHLKNTQLDREAFEAIRSHAVLPEFEKLKLCFERIPVVLQNGLPPLAEQIVGMLKAVEIDAIKKDEKECSEKSLDEKFLRLQRQPLFDPKSKKLLVPLKSLFRINIHDFLANVMQVSPLGANEFADNEYEPINSRDLFWYCNAWLVREGIRAIVHNMQGHEKFFIILTPKNFAAKLFVRYKIILRDSGKGLSSVARAFIAGRGHLSTVASFLQGFCELNVRSKMEGEEAIEYDVFSGTMDLPCSKMKRVGTEFEIIFTQRRDR
jgi:hypothetical protein